MDGYVGDYKAQPQAQLELMFGLSLAKMGKNKTTKGVTNVSQKKTNLLNFTPKFYDQL